MLAAALLFAIKVAAGCDASHFLARAYQDLLGRQIDAAATTYWLGMMKNGATRTQVASQLIRSVEYTNGRVQTLYNLYLHRPANGSEVAYFAGMLQHGSTDEQVQSSMLSSAEYFSRRAGGTNAGFISALYQDILGRAADPQAVSLFAQQLASGGSRSAIAQQILTSPEARQRWINALYAKYVHRGATRTPVSGGQDQVVAAIIGSDEYCRQ